MAVIDVGTHSILYLLVEKNARGDFISPFQEIQSVRLGRNVDNAGTIRGEVLTETLQVLKHYRALASKQNADQIVVVGTRVFRAARNRKRVCKRIQNETGLNAEMLTEKEEAEWSYRGALYERKWLGQNTMVDIGGGSTEVVLGNGNQILDWESTNLGAVGVTERFIHHDPPLPSEFSVMETSVFSSLKDRGASLLEQGERLIAVGGTPTTLAALDLSLKKYDSHRVDRYVMRYLTIENILDRMKRIPIAERRKLLKLDPDRADIILAGTTILKICMRLGRFEEVIVSDRGLRFGIALREFTATHLEHGIKTLK